MTIFENVAFEAQFKIFFYFMEKSYSILQIIKVLNLKPFHQLQKL